MKKYNNREDELVDIIKKDNEIINLYERWMIARNNEYSICDFIKKNKFEKVAIYGMGSLGKALCSEFCVRDINIEYIIEQNEKRHNDNFQFYTMEDVLPKVDLIIITAITYYDEIVEELSKKINCALLSLDDIVP